MDKIRIRQNYENYERVQKAFRDFIHALVWESMDIDSGVHEDEINEHIERYCRNNGDQMISLTNDSVTKFIKSLQSRYDVYCYHCDENGNILEEGMKNYQTDNLKLALKKGAEFYRYHAEYHPTVNIFDNETNEYIAEWD
jgi:hypothetical protein